VRPRVFDVVETVVWLLPEGVVSLLRILGLGVEGFDSVVATVVGC
jgi:hypothetical protein